MIFNCESFSNVIVVREEQMENAAASIVSTTLEEHKTQGRGMSEYYQEIYEEAMRRLCTCKIGV